MQVTKFRVATDDTGLVPAGRYFAQLARGLEKANAREAARCKKHDAEDRVVEARYRRASAVHEVTRDEHRAMM